jgi:hypothetical protein
MATKKPAKKPSKAVARPRGGISALSVRKSQEPKLSSGDLKSKIRSKHGLAPGFNGIVKDNGSVMHITVDAKGREKILSCYIPE